MSELGEREGKVFPWLLHHSKNPPFTHHIPPAVHMKNRCLTPNTINRCWIPHIPPSWTRHSVNPEKHTLTLQVNPHTSPAQSPPQGQSGQETWVMTLLRVAAGP